MEEINNIPRQIRFCEGSIFNQEADAMVLSANPYKDSPVGTGLDEEVYNRVGEGREDIINIRNAVFFKQNTNKLELGTIFVTGAGKMAEKMIFKKIIHVIVPAYSKKFSKEKNLRYLRSIIEKIFSVAKEYDIRSLSMPLIGSGVRGFKHKDVREIIVAAFTNVLNADTEYFGGFTLNIVELNNKKNIKDYPGMRELIEMAENNIKFSNVDLMDEDCLKRWVKNMDPAIKELRENGIIARDLKNLDIEKYILEVIRDRYLNKSRKKTKGYSKNLFIELLDKYEAQKNLTDAELLRRANRIEDKPKLSKMRRDQSRLGRALIVRIAMALELPLEEAKSFIEFGSAGIEFPDPEDDFEMIVYDSIKNKVYDVVMLDKLCNNSPEYPDTERGTDIDISRDDRDNDR